MSQVSLPHLVPGDCPQDGKLRPFNVETEEVDLVSDPSGQQEAVQGVALNTLSVPQLLRDAVSNLKSY